MMKHPLLLCGFGILTISGPLPQAASAQPPGAAERFTAKPLILKPDSFRHYAEAFNQSDHELYSGGISNADAWAFLKENIPLFDCPDKDIEEIYYFRWWTFRKHIAQTPAGFVISEFLPPVGWAGKFNTISCAAGHHLHEGRWLSDPRFLDDYSKFWFRGGGEPRRYSFWAAESIWARYLVTGDRRLPLELLPDLIRNYEAWESDHRDPNGLFWQEDDRDGMECSISGTLDPKHEGYRPTINSYMYGDAAALAQLALLAGQTQAAEKFRAKAAELKRLVQERLWNSEANFFEVLPRNGGDRLTGVREEHGFTPWYFGLPDAAQAVAWKQLTDPRGFYAPFGPTTAEQRDPRFAVSYQGHECQWNGPSWPFATAVTLTALANVLNDCVQNAVSAADYFDLLKIYTRSQHLRRDDGSVVPWIDEDLNPLNGDWIARTLLKARGSAIPERGKDYNHSTYCDLVISGLAGLRPRADDIVEVNPLVPRSWDYFCLDQIRYHGHWLTILWDRTGERYHQGKGLRLYADAVPIATADSLGRIRGFLPPSSTPAYGSGSNRRRVDQVCGQSGHGRQVRDVL